MRFSILFGAVLMLGMAAGPNTASAVPITGGSTVVAPTLDLSVFDVELLGTAGAGVTFPVTGGDLDGNLAGRIEHEGSGLKLSSHGSSLALENFIIDTINTTVFGDVSVDGLRVADDAPLFDFDLSGLTPEQITDINNPQLALTLTGTAVGAINNLSGLMLTPGTQFGFAATAPTFNEVPAPGGLALILVALGGLAMRVKRS